MALLVNTRNANAFTGKAGYEGLKKIAEELSNQLNTKQKLLTKILIKLLKSMM